MAVDVSRLTEGWLELESDPGLFMLLLEDFGVKNVHVEEIYDLTKPFDSPVYGFIFLFRWIEERRSRRKIVEENEMFLKEEEDVNNIFFAQQMVPNSCATHALVSVLLNCSKIELGDTLTTLKQYTSGMTPENKGYAIGNSPELARAHNSHAMPQHKGCVDKTSAGITTSRYAGEAFHFVSYVPINGRLFELDGLKPYPIDHGPCEAGEDWTEKFRRVMTERLGIAAGEPCHDIRFNLMALIPDRRIALSHKLNMLKTNREIIETALHQLLKANTKEEEVEEAITIENETETKEEKKFCSKADPIYIPTSDAEEFDKDEHESAVENSSKENIAPKKVSVNSTDYSTPLTIQTSPAPSTSSTDTSSEVGSAFNSPLGWGWNSSQSSPTCSSKDFRKFVVIRVAGEDKYSPAGRTKRVTEVSGKKIEVKHWDESSPDENNEAMNALLSKYPELKEPHTFAPKDLLALLDNVEAEIKNCECNLKDENDKQSKYKVDDSRRTHNYDEFVCTFLSMLAEQGKLADLVQQHLLVHKRPGLHTGKVGRPLKIKKFGKKNKNKKTGKKKRRKKSAV